MLSVLSFGSSGVGSSPGQGKFLTLILGVVVWDIQLIF